MSVANSNSDPAVLVAGARTPMGRLLGGLSSLSAAQLGAVAIRAAIERSGVDADSVNEVLLGQVLSAGVGQNAARQAAVGAGLSMSVPAATFNKVCLSGLATIALADLATRSGRADVMIAGGMESMSNAPHLLIGSRTGTKYGDTALIDSMAHDGLSCAFDEMSMGEATERYTARYELTREEQDAFAVRSHQRAAEAEKNGLLAEEIAPVTIPGRKGESTVVSADEGIRADTSMESLGRLRPAFAKDGTITAGSSSPISDGAAAVVVMTRSRAESLGLPWIAEIVSTAGVGGPDPSLHEQPAHAINKALAIGGLTAADLDLVEINEAFAAVGIVSQRLLGLSDDQVNVNGGAIALGHPIGMSGARVTLTLALELARRGGGIGAAALCGGGGQGDAIVLRVPRRA